MIITSAPFLCAMPFSGISGNSVYMHQILKSFSQSSYIFDWESAGGALELLDDIAL